MGRNPSEEATDRLVVFYFLPTFAHIKRLANILNKRATRKESKQ